MQIHSKEVCLKGSPTHTAVQFANNQSTLLVLFIYITLHAVQCCGAFSRVGCNQSNEND